MKSELKLVRAYWLAAILGCATAIVPGAEAADSSFRVKLATLVPKGTSYHQILQEMAEKWRQTPGGSVALTLYTDGTMGGEADMVRRMRVGQIQAGLLTVGGLSEIDPSVRALQNMPMMFRSLDEVDYVSARLQPMLERRLEEKGFVVLFWTDAGWVKLFSRRPALRPEDFKRLKMYVSSGDNDQIDIMKRLGYQPVPLEYTDVLTSLQTGLIDAVPSPPFYALAGQFYGPAPHMLDINWVPIVGGLVITKKAWEELPTAARDRLRQAAAEAGTRMKARSRAEMVESVEAMQKRGLTVHTLASELEAEWRSLAETVYPQIRSRIVPAEMFDEVVRLLTEYRSTPGKPGS